MTIPRRSTPDRPREGVMSIEVDETVEWKRHEEARIQEIEEEILRFLFTEINEDRTKKEKEYDALWEDVLAAEQGWKARLTTLFLRQKDTQAKAGSGRDILERTLLQRRPDKTETGYIPDEEKRAERAVQLARKIAENAFRLESEGRYDELTGAPKLDAIKHHFTEQKKRLDTLAHTTPEQHMIVVSFDVNGFKQINDAQGHEAGDTILKAIVQLLQSRLRLTEDDMIGRVGGDEFMVIFPSVGGGIDMIQPLINRVENVVRLHVKDTHDQPVTVSCGAYAISPNEDIDFETARRRSDQASRLAKIKKQHKTQLWSTDMMEEVFATDESMEQFAEQIAHTNLDRFRYRWERLAQEGKTEEIRRVARNLVSNGIMEAKLKVEKAAALSELRIEKAKNALAT